MESKDRWVDAGYDGESKQEKCQYAEQTKGWSLAGRKLSTPASTLKSVVPLMSPKGCFHAAAKVVDSVVEGAGLHSCCHSSVSLHLSLQWETGAAGIWITTTWWDDFLSRDALKSPPPFFFLIRMLFTTLPALLLIVNLITLTICKVAAWSVCYDTSAEWKRWMGTIEIRFDSIIY